MARRFARGKAMKAQFFHYNTSTKQYPGQADVAIMAGYVQLDRQSFALEGGGAGAGLVSMYDLFVDQGLDIRLNDKVLLGSSTTIYKVFKIFDGRSGASRHKRVTVATDAQA